MERQRDMGRQRHTHREREGDKDRETEKHIERGERQRHTQREREIGERDGERDRFNSQGISTENFRCWADRCSGGQKKPYTFLSLDTLYY